MEKLAFSTRVFDIKRASAQALIHAYGLSTLREVGVAESKLRPEGIKTAKAIDLIASKINDAVATIEDEASKLNSDVTQRMVRSNRVEIRLIK